MAPDGQISILQWVFYHHQKLYTFGQCYKIFYRGNLQPFHGNEPQWHYKLPYLISGALYFQCQFENVLFHPFILTGQWFGSLLFFFLIGQMSFPGMVRLAAQVTTCLSVEEVTDGVSHQVLSEVDDYSSPIVDDPQGIFGQQPRPHPIQLLIFFNLTLIKLLYIIELTNIHYKGVPVSYLFVGKPSTKTKILEYSQLFSNFVTILIKPGKHQQPV